MRCNVFLVLSFLLTLFILIQNHVITSYYWHVLLLYNANHAFLYQQSILYEKHERDRINPALIIRNGFDLKTGKDFSINAGFLTTIR